SRYLLVLPLLELVYFAVSQKPIMGKHRTASVGALYAGITNPHRDWIDRAVGTIYDLGDPLQGGLPETKVTVDRQTGVMSANGQPVRSRYVLTDGSVQLAGKVVAQDTTKGAFLYQLDGPMRQTSYVTGLYPNDTWSGPSVTYTRLSCTGGSLTV